MRWQALPGAETVSSIDEATIPEYALWSTLADQNRLQHAQMKHGNRPASENLSHPQPRDSSARSHAQPRYPLASIPMFYTEQRTVRK